MIITPLERKLNEQYVRTYLWPLMDGYANKVKSEVLQPFTSRQQIIDHFKQRQEEIVRSVRNGGLTKFLHVTSLMFLEEIYNAEYITELAIERNPHILVEKTT